MIGEPVVVSLVTQTYLQRLAGRIHERFRDLPVGPADLEAAFGLAHTSAKSLLAALYAHRYAQRLSRGVYRVFPEASAPLPWSLSLGDLDSAARAVHDILDQAGIPFLISGLSVLAPLAHHLLWWNPVLVIVARQSEEWAAAELSAARLAAAVNPSAETVRQLRNLMVHAETEGSVPAILRPRSDLSGADGHIATPERAIVDLAAEIMRYGFPVPWSEIGRIIATLQERGHPWNFGQLRHHARQHGLFPVFDPVLSELQGDRATHREQAPNAAAEILGGLLEVSR